MSSEWIYPIEVRQEAGAFHAYSNDLPEAIASGSTEEAALAEMRHALAAAVRGRIKDGMDLVAPSWPAEREANRPVALPALPARIAAKASIYAAWKASGLSKVALAERIGRTETEVRRILDPDHGTKLDQLDEAAAALGGRLAVRFMAA